MPCLDAARRRSYGSYLLGVSCASGTACTAVGYYDLSTGYLATLAEVWNGSTWTIGTTPDPSTSLNQLEAVSCTAATACTAVGSYMGSASLQVTLGERWNGSSWTVQTTANPDLGSGDELSGVSCHAARACTAVGSHDSNSLTLAESWNGSTWTAQTTPSRGTEVSDLDSVSCTVAATCTAAGESENFGGAVKTLAERE